MRSFLTKSGITVGNSGYGTIYWPLVDTTPSASGQNTKLLRFAGDKVVASGKVYHREGSKAIVIEKIEAQTWQPGSYREC